jgi:hypothetical protein
MTANSHSQASSRIKTNIPYTVTEICSFFCINLMHVSRQTKHGKNKMIMHTTLLSDIFCTKYHIPVITAIHQHSL